MKQKELKLQKRTKVLVVEDEVIVARDVLNMLQSLGYESISVTSTSEDAIKTAKKESPHIVLMDIMLEGKMNGLEAADYIYTNLNIPIVYLTSYAEENIIQKAKKTGPFGYLLKPFEERDLQTTIEIALYKFEMEMKLKRREKWLSTILENIGDGVVATDEKGMISFINKQAETLTGWKFNEIRNKNLNKIYSIYSEKTNEPLTIPLNKLLNGERTRIHHEVVLHSKSGDKIFADQDINPTLDEGGRVTGVVVTFSDITQRKKAERQIKESWKNQKKAMEGAVEAMAYTIETRDPYTAGHQRRVTKLAVKIAEEMGLEEDKVEGIRMAGLLHDIGKIYIPAEILSKPGKISEVEYNIIKTHPKVGADILKSIDFPWPVSEIVSQHHERIDGSGYPNGLSGDEILLEARVLAVADVIEAMASHRPYREALSLEKALDEIKENKGKLYDEKASEAALKVCSAEDFSFD
ncbi:MAG TPA: HD domain-containing phosphohydrolase [Acidobacteriota bacterium]|nr:HD domain-containing phosphohydrolase [Acidobacteriota bacterium]